MAQRTVTLTMTTFEESALSSLMARLFEMEEERGEISAVMGYDPLVENHTVAALARINAALNCVR